MPLTLTEALANAAARVTAALDNALPNPALIPESLHDAMRYAVLTPGKRLRPFLVYQAGALMGAEEVTLDAPACAVEMIHAYSLVHDDLPAMDDDDLRRGQPTCHRAYDEATAILVGDALQSLAFQLIADAGIPAAEARLEMIKTLAHAAGSRGMVGGQAMDLAAAGQTLSTAQLEDVHRNKTGALILASLQLGALCGAWQDRASREALNRYGECIGLAFQVWDDILDVEGDAAALGKQSGADAQHDKATYPALMGLEPAREFAQALSEEAAQALQGFDARADLLRALAQYIVSRDR